MEALGCCEASTWRTEREAALRGGGHTKASEESADQSPGGQRGRHFQGLWPQGKERMSWRSRWLPEAFSSVWKEPGCPLPAPWSTPILTGRLGERSAGQPLGELGGGTGCPQGGCVQSS